MTKKEIEIYKSFDNPFEEYLKEVFAKNFLSNGGLDDDMPDAESNWFGKLDEDKIIKYGNEFFIKLWDKQKTYN